MSAHWNIRCASKRQIFVFFSNQNYELSFLNHLQHHMSWKRGVHFNWNLIADYLINDLIIMKLGKA